MDRKANMPSVDLTRAGAGMTRDELRHRIIAAVKAIPRGRVAAYGQIAQRAGAPGRARLVGRVLREAPTSLRLPWHRVLRADGGIALPAGSEGFATQVARLQREGVRVQRGRVDLSAFGPEPSLDESLWRWDFQKPGRG